MTPAGLSASALVALGLAGAGLLALPAVRRSRLGVVHPSVAWLALHAVFFGLGAIALTLSGELDAGTAWYVAGAAIAMGAGVAASDLLAVRRSAGARAVTGGAAAAAAPAVDDAPLRPWVAVLLLAAGIAAIGPSLLANGLPLLAGDPTAARSELAGLPVQVLRICLPAGAAAAFVLALRSPRRRDRVITGAVLAGALVLALLLASRYLAAELAAVLVVTWILAGRRIPARAIVGVAVAGAVAFGTVQVVRAPALAEGREIAFAMERTVSRVLLIQPRTLGALEAAIPSDTPYFLGLTWLRRLGPVVGRPDIPNLGYWIYPQMFPDQDASIVGYAAPGLIGEAWANFGAFGLLLFGGLGVVLERLGALVRRRRSGTADLAAAAVAIVILARTHALGLNGSLVLLGLLAAWRALAGGGLPGLLRDAGATLRWRDRSG